MKKKKMDPELEEKARKLSQLALPHTAPIILSLSDGETPADVLNTASCALVDTGPRRLLITNDHVWSEFEAVLNQNEDARIFLAVGMEKPIQPITGIRLIEKSKDLDLAILDMTGIRALAGTKNKYSMPRSWPPRRPEVGETLIVMGFPKSGRSPIDNGANMLFQTTAIIDDVTSCTDRRLLLADHEESRVVILHDGSLADEDDSFGGMSGCPAFAARDRAIEFVGVLYQSSDGPHGTFLISHADFLLPSGQIDWPNIAL